MQLCNASRRGKAQHASKMGTQIQEMPMTLQRVLPPGMQPADGKAGIRVGISFAPDMEGYQISD